MHNLHLNAVVPPEKDGHRLDQVLTHLFPQYSRAYFQKQIHAHKVKVNAKPTEKRSILVFSGQHIEVTSIVEIPESVWKGDGTMPLNILYEDEALLIVNKPAGIVTHPAPGHLDKTLVNALLHHAPSLAQLPRSGIIHRLDKDTSGLLVVPKTLSAYTDLTRKIAKRNITRIYYAIVKGHFTQGGTINFPIGRHPTLRQKQAVTLKGKPAITHYSILERFQQHTLLQVKLETGRTHQIRVHMAHIKHPILGDPVYAIRTKQLNLSFERQALHATTLTLQHPLTQQLCTWEAPLPNDMEMLLRKLREASFIRNLDPQGLSGA